MEKQLYNLEPKDLIEYPVWIFPMAETVENEETIRPVTNSNQSQDLQVIVRANFTDQINRNYIGYIYWGEPKKVGFLKPVMFFDESGEAGIAFWNGILEPEDTELNQAKGILNTKSFPIKFQRENVFGLKSIMGELYGVYYINENEILDFKSIE